MVILPALMKVLRPEFGVDLDTLGWVYGLSGFMFGLGAIPSGWLENRFGGRRLLIVTQVGVTLSCFFVYVSQNLNQFIFALFLLGLSASIYHPAGLTLISRRIRHISRAMGYHGIAGSGGLAFGPLLGSWFAINYSWRLAYGTMALMCFLLTLATITLLPSKKRSVDTDDIVYTKVTKTHPLAIYYIFVVLVGLTFYGFISYMPIHFSDNSGDFLIQFNTVTKGGLLTTIVLAAGIIGQLLGGKLGDQIDRSVLLPLISLAHVPLLIIFGLRSGSMLMLSGILLGIIHFSLQPIGNSLIAEFTTSASRGIGYGVSFFMSFGIGSFASGIGGSLAVKYGVSMVFPFIATLMLAAFFLSIYLKRILR